MVPNLMDPNWYPQILSCQMLGVFFLSKHGDRFLDQKSQVSFDGSISSSRCRTSRWQSAVAGLCIHSVWETWDVSWLVVFHVLQKSQVFLWNKMYVYICKYTYMYTYMIYIYIYYIYTINIPRYCTTFTKDFKHFYDWDVLNLSTNGLFVSFLPRRNSERSMQSGPSAKRMRV